MSNKLIIGDKPEQLNCKMAHIDSALLVDGFVYTEDAVRQLKAERDALALKLKASEENAHQQRDMKAKAREQRDALVSKMVLIHESVSQAVNLIPAGAIDIISNIKAAQDMNTAQALAEIRAEAGRAGFIAGINARRNIEYDINSGDWMAADRAADEYAAKVRQGGAA